VIHEHPLKLYGYLLSCAKIPPAEKSDPDWNAEIRMFNNSQPGAQRVRPQEAGSQHSHPYISGNQRQLQAGTMQLCGNNEWHTQPFNALPYLLSHQTPDWIENPISPIKFRATGGSGWA
jgi:hypothetical protein